MSDKVKGKSHDEAAYKEAEASAAVTPGMGIGYTGTNAQGDLQVGPVSSADEVDPAARFAREQRIPPRDVGGEYPLDSEYEAGNNVEYFVFQSGDEVENALLAAGGDLTTAADATVTVGDKLGFNDDGSLKITSTAGAAVAEAIEAVDNSGAGAGEHARIAIEVL